MGWLLSISTQEEVFAMHCMCINPSQVYRNGNLCASTSSVVNTTSDLFESELSFSYEYDKLNQLRSAIEDNAGSDIGEWFEYDLNGNIVHLERSFDGVSVQDAAISYDGNQIVSVNDASEDVATGLAPRFPSGVYSDAVAYDANGNITRDDTRAISSVTYHPFYNLPKRVTFADGSYLAWDYRPDGTKVKSTSSEKYIRVTVTVNSKGDTIVRERTMYNTDLRKYIGAFEISGNTWRVYHDAGHSDLNTSTGALTHRYYVQDYLGSTRAVIDESGNVLQSTAYYPSGVPLTPNELTPQTIKLHTGKDFFDLQGAGWYDNHARYYDCLIPTFKSQDPLAEKYPWLSPYNHCANNPMRFVDPDGRNPIYNRKGVLIGTADNGIQGTPIIMDEKNFYDKITVEEAQKFDLGVAGLLNNDAIKRYNESIKSLSNRPDWDGYITIDEANDWYKNGSGAALYADINKIDFSGIVSLGENYVGQVKTFNLLLNSHSLNDGLVYGNITLKRYPNHSIRAYSDKYDFDMKSWRNLSNWGRNIETIIGGFVAGNGTAFNINIYGSTTLRPKYRWIK